ncbi:MAG: SMP-30/gluconolactonase/LRE family protein [Chloroflexi bacterium]|nr:SMP-30/gluconolactonase/LRE family protein [Chloroflexota bacterium]
MFNIISKKFEELIDSSSKLELLANNFEFTEGPVWHKEKKCLYFSDIPSNTLFCYNDKRGVSIFRQPSNFSNGLTLNKQGMLIVCEHRSRSVTIQTDDGFETISDQFNGKKLNSPNDIIISRDGTIFFSDPIYGLQEGMGGPAIQELDFQGVYMLKPGENEPVLLFDDFERPNGLALSDDENTLFVNDTVCQHIRVFTKNSKGEYSNGTVFTELFGEGLGRPDGMKLDNWGNVFCTGPGGIWVISSTGELLGKILLEQKTANLAWGDDDCRSLYITSGTNLYRLRCKTAGKSPMEI